MSGVSAGSRLDQLRALRARIDQEIKAAEREAALTRPKPTSQTTHKGTRAPDAVARRLAELGVTSYEVKTWALETGRITAIARGRVSTPLVEFYAAAHSREPSS